MNLLNTIAGAAAGLLTTGNPVGAIAGGVQGALAGGGPSNAGNIQPSTDGTLAAQQTLDEGYEWGAARPQRREHAPQPGNGAAVDDVQRGRRREERAAPRDEHLARRRHEAARGGHRATHESSSLRRPTTPAYVGTIRQTDGRPHP